MMRLVALAVAASAAAWLVREYRRSDVDGWLDIFDARTRRVVREEIAAADAAWDAKVTEADQQVQQLAAELDDPKAVAAWLWRSEA